MWTDYERDRYEDDMHSGRDGWSWSRPTHHIGECITTYNKNYKEEKKKYNKDLKKYKKEKGDYIVATQKYSKACDKRAAIYAMHSKVEHIVQRAISKAYDDIEYTKEVASIYITYLSLANGDKIIAYRFLEHTHPRVGRIKHFKKEVLKYMLEETL